MSRASAVVCHAGPGTIMDCRRAGLKPVVVPRRRFLGEVVDDHQLSFALRLAGIGHVKLVQTEGELKDALDAVVDDPLIYRIDPTRDGDLSATIRRFAALAEPLLGHPGSGPRSATPPARRSPPRSGVISRLPDR